MKYRNRHIDETYFQTLAITVEDFISQGLRTFLVTSSGPGEGKSTITAYLGWMLARSGKQSVVVVDADSVRPTIHTMMSVRNTPGLGEILHEIDQADVHSPGPSRSNLRDVLELLSLQGRSGRLLINGQGEEFTVSFQKGRIAALKWPQRPQDSRLGALLVQKGKITEHQREAALLRQYESGHPLGKILCGLGHLEHADLESSIQSQIKEGVHRILSLQNPETHFEEGPGIDYRAAVPCPLGIQGLIQEWSGYGGYGSFTSSLLFQYLQETKAENLSVLAAGETAYDLQVSRTAVQLQSLMHMMARQGTIVLVDSPPVCFAGPAVTLSTLVDGVILVVKSDGLGGRTVQRAKETLSVVKANLLGVILNGVNAKDENALVYEYTAYRK